MSYILEALQKSEHARQQGKVPGLNTVPVMMVAVDSAVASHRWPYVLAAASLALVVAVLAWSRPWLDRPLTATPAAPAPAVAPTGATPAPAAPPHEALPPADAPRTTPGIAVPAAGGLTPDARQIPAQASAPATDASSAARVPVAPATARGAAPRGSQAPTAARPRAPGHAVPAPAATPAPPTDRIFGINELPAAVRNTLPTLTVSGHSYAEEPAQRMAVINDRLVAEGEEAGPGVTLAHIGRDGVVLEFQGYRFRP